MAEKLTAKRIDALKPQAQRYEVTEPGGLGVRVTPTGAKSFFYFYKKDGRTRRLTLGTYKQPGDTKPTMTLSDARNALAEAKAERAGGVDPAQAKAEKKQAAKLDPTVEDFVGEYLEGWARPNKKTWKKDKRQLEKNILPYIGKKKLSELRRKDIVWTLNKLKEAGKPVEHNRTLAVVRKMLNYAVGTGALEVSPATNIPQMKEVSRDRVFSRQEIRLLFASLDETNLFQGTRLAVEMLLRTAQRPGEIRWMERDEVDLDQRAWIIPSEKTKNNLAHIVPLTERMVGIIQKADALVPNSEFIFASPKTGGPLSEFSLSQAIRRAINPAERPGKDVAPEAEPIMERATPHDLRRTAATLITELGFNRLVVDKLLNHKDPSVGGVYDRHSYDKEKRQALEAWERDLEATLTGQSQVAEVVLLGLGDRREGQ